jgi:uncharacterized membrane protein YeiH
MFVIIMLEVIYILGIFVAAMSGALVAGFKNLDWVGTITLAILTALGGGTLRDVLLNRTVFWIDSPHYVWVSILASLFTIFYASYRKPPLRLLLICDAVGLAFFTILGAQIAEQYSVSSIVVIIMALLTGVAGGVLRDVFANEVPYLFRATESLYSIVALLGVLCYILINQLDFASDIANIMGIAMIIFLRFFAIHYDFRLPQFRIKSV